MDKIHAYINSHSSEFNAKIRYCTLSEYFDGIYNDPPADLPTYKHDFFPYNDDPYSYWTGFYTSRPALKSLVRELEALLRATEQAYVLSTLTKTLNGEYNLAGPSYVDLVLARNLSALSADHDFMAGTSREATILDMFDKMYTSRKHASLVLSSSIHNLLGIASKERKAKVLSGARIHSDDPSVTIGNYLAIHNSLAWTRNTIVKVLSNNSNIAVIDIDNNRACVQSQLVPSWVPQEFHKKREAPATYEFYFYAQLPPLGVKVYQIVASSPSCFANSSSIQPLTGNYAATIENDHVSFSVNFDSANANTTLTINNKKENSKYSILQQFLRYITCNGTKGGPADLCSGAYLVN